VTRRFDDPTLVIRSLASALIIVSIWFIAFPYYLLSSGIEPFPFRLGPLRVLGCLPLGVGAVLFGWVTWIFASAGGGTPLVFDAPVRFVPGGPYRWVRNPMYVADILIITGQAMLFESSALLVYGALFWLGLHVMVVLFEEPLLRKRFGDSYRAYCTLVPRWIPRFGVRDADLERSAHQRPPT
jgi:protein-S-isoprenylcysteine O-methyltransferase Ste14